jgi:hypothetical protein
MDYSTLSRAQLLALKPAVMLENGLRVSGAVDETGLTDNLRTLGALAFSEQLRDADVPLDALDLCMVVLDQTREQYSEWTGEARAAAVAGLEVQASGFPVLARWLAVVIQAIGDSEDLVAAVRFLEATRQMWETNRILRQRQRGVES